MGTGRGDHLRLHAGIPEDFHGSLVGDVRTRTVGSPAILVDQQVADAVARQQQGGREAGGATADNQDGDFDDFGGVLQVHDRTPHSCS
ncbi:hypothetical protein D9M68_697670 [compost metagenome]